MSKLLHLEHVEDYVFNGEFLQPIDVIAGIANRISENYSKTGPISHLKITTKYDGAPAIVFGINPENGKFFIGTKSVFNKRIPKICYGEEDIDLHYGDNIALAVKLKSAFENLACEFYSFSSFPVGVYQGDIMYFAGEFEWDDKTVFFTPNTITYRANKESTLGQSIIETSMGLVVHTRYEGNTITDMQARFDIDHSDFISNVVNFIDPSLNCNNLINETQFRAIGDWLDFCEKSFKTEQCDRTIFERHDKTLKMFVNHCVRIGETGPEVNMYEMYLKNRKLTDLHEEVVKKRTQFSSLFAIHRCLTHCKKILLDGLSKTSTYFTEVNGKPVKGEGFVVVYHGVPCKFVNRLEFSRLNFANQRFAKA